MCPKLIKLIFFLLTLSKGFSRDLKDLVFEYLPESNQKQFLQIYEENHELKNLNFGSIMDILNEATNESCHECDMLLQILKEIPPNQKSVDFIKNLACDKKDPFLTRRECIGFIDLLGLPILYILNNTKIPLEERCSVLSGHKCSTFLGRKMTNITFWEIFLPEKKRRNQTKFKPINMIEAKNKILHLTDIHLDLSYKPGSNSICNEIICCRPASDTEQNTSTPAGYWGELNGNCDVPYNFIQNTFRQIKKQHPDIGYIFWTGDNVPHEVWNTSKEMSLEYNRVLAELIQENFQDVVVFPALGNHDTHPVNMYVLMEVPEESNFSIKWLYGKMSDDIWSQWFTEDNKATFKRGGFYSRMINKNWKIIVLNSNTGYKLNFWRIYNPIDPDGQLAWLVKELDHAEQIGASVSILGHISPSEMYDAWLHNYIRIIDRYSHVITGIYSGHMHSDEIAIFYNQEQTPVGANYISGSLTTFSYLNPCYKIIEMDNRGQPLNYDVYFLDINKENDLVANNISRQPVWVHEFSAKESYQMKDLTPSSWDEFLRRADKDLDLCFTYAEHYHRHSMKFSEINNFTVDRVQELVRSIKTVSPFNYEKLEN